ncbi:MAG: chitooligosaccharide deacetylase [Bacilli bacterium]|nr:chitooligosaccharide deacetylase [Bacilli bacterium]
MSWYEPYLHSANFNPDFIRQATPPLTGGSEGAGGRPPHTQHIDYASMFPGEVILHGPPNVRQVALTFDDGPDDLWTPRILDVLRHYNVHATFFLVGHRAEAHPEVLRRIVREGHVAGNHTYDHPKLTDITPAEVESEITRTSDIIQRTAGVKPALFRPPYGALSVPVIEQIRRLGYKIIFWDVDSLDWSGLTAAQVAANILAHVHPGSIILQHSAGGVGESLEDTVQALPYVITTLEREGYQFRTVPELVGITAYQ